MLIHGVEEGSTEYSDLISELSILTTVGSHKNLVTFYGACIDDLKTPVIVQELVEGPDLQTLFNSMHTGFKLGRCKVYRWAKDILSALNHLHDRDPIIMHRDLKPSNILVTRDLRTLKLADFGLAKQLLQVERMQMAHASNTGTLRYMAPEVFVQRNVEGQTALIVAQDGAVYTEKADIYSAALIIWTMVTGFQPYINIAQQPRGRPNLALAAARWPGLAGLLDSMWQHEHEARPSAKLCLARLCTFACTGLRTGMAMRIASAASHFASLARPWCLQNTLELDDSERGCPFDFPSVVPRSS